jgi:ferritin
MNKYYELSDEAMEIIAPLAEIELEQSTFYNQLAVVANKLGFLMAQKYFNQEAIEEKEHFMGWVDYISGRGNKYTVPAIGTTKSNSKNLYGLIEMALAKEIEVSKLYAEQGMKLFAVDQLAYQKLIGYLQIQNDAIIFYTDLCAVFEGLDKAGELTAEHSYFENK